MVRYRKIRGRWIWEIDRTFCRVDGTKERYRRAAQVQNKRAAEAEELRVVQRWLEHGTLEPEKTEPQANPNATWEDAVAYFRKHELPLKKFSTRRGYEQLLASKGFARWAGRKLLEVKWAPEVRGWLLDLPGSPSTRRNHLIALRSVLRSVSPNKKTAEPGVYFHQMPLLPAPPKVGETVVNAPTPQQVAALLGEARPKHCGKAVRKNQLAFALGALAGLRASEVRGLRVRDVDLDQGLIKIRTGLIGGLEGTPKSGHEREIPLSSELKSRLEAWIADNDLKPESYVCTGRGQRAWSDNGILNAFHRAAARLRIEGLTFHSLRHYFVTTLLAPTPDGGAKTDVKTAQKLAGHANIKTTMRYAHTTRERGRAAIRAAFG
jgi:integrase